MTDAEVIAALTPAQTVGLTAWAEARSRLQPGTGWVENPIAAMADIVCVIGNRAHDPRWQALGLKGVCLARAQFSCWLKFGGADANKDPQHLSDNYEALLARARRLVVEGVASQKLAACIEVAELAVAVTLQDKVGGATHYFAPASMVPPGRVPAWVAGATLTAERYGHRFYAGVK